MMDNGITVQPLVAVVWMKGRETSRMESSHYSSLSGIYIQVSAKNAVQLLRCCAYDDEETSHSTHSLLHPHFISKI